MANSTRKMNVEIGFMANKKSLEDLKLQLNGAIAALKQNSAKDPLNEGLKQNVKVATELQQILNKCYNADLGTVNIGKFSTELKKANISVGEIRQSLVNAGTGGAVAFNNLQRQILSTKMEIKESSKVLNDMAKTFYNAFKYNIATKAIQTVTGSLERAVGYAEQLDHSLNDIRIVTDKSAESMEKFAKDANKASKQLGSSTLDYTNASLIYYQQGLSDSDVKARTETTLKVANVTGQTGEQVSEELTAVWNGYKVSAEEAETYVDKLAAVAATTASDLEELSTGMSKVASAAASMGVDVDQLNGMLSTIISVTRQAPESAGTALKTIFARMGDLELDGEDEYGVKLGEVSSSLASMGVQLLDTKGNMRDLGEVIEEVGNKWNSGAWSDAEKQALAIDLAGKRQYNNLLALFDNWQMYSSAVQTSADSVGTLQHQQDIYLESTDAKLTQLKATWQGLYDTIIDNGELNKGIEGLTNVVDAFEKMLASLGGGMKSIAGFGLMISNIFNKQISEGLLKVRDNFRIATKNANALKMAMEAANQQSVGVKIGANGKSEQAAAQYQANAYKSLEPVVKSLDKDQYNILVTEIAQNAEQVKKVALLKEELNLLDEKIKDKNLESEIEKRLVDEENYRKSHYKHQGVQQSEINKDELRYESLEGVSQEAINNAAEKRKFIAGNKNIPEASGELRSAVFDFNKSLDGAEDLNKKELEALIQKKIESLKQSVEKANELIKDADIKTKKEIQFYINGLEDTIKNVETDLENSAEEALGRIRRSQANHNGNLNNEKAKKVSKNSDKNAIKIANAELEKQAKKEEEIAELARQKREAEIKYKQEVEEEIRQAQNLAQTQKQIADDNYFRAKTQAIQGVTSSLIAATSASSSFVSIWSSDDLSFGDKLVQSFTTLSFMLPQMIKGFTSLNTLAAARLGVEESNVAVTISELGLETTLEAKKIAELITEGKITEAKELALSCEELSKTFTEEELTTLIEQLAVEEGITKEKAKQNILTETAIKNSKKNKVNIGKNNGGSNDSSQTTQKGLSKIFSKLGQIFAKNFAKILLGAGIAAIITKKIIEGIQKANAQKNLTNAVNSFEINQEKYEKNKEKADSLKSTNQEYQELVKKRESGELSTLDFQREASKLLTAAGQSDLIIQMLSGDIAGVTEALEYNTNALYDTAGKNVDDAKGDLSAIISNAIEANASSTQLDGFGSTLDVITGPFNDWNKTLKNGLEELAEKNNIEGLFQKGKLNIDALSKLIAASPKEFAELIKSNRSDEARELEKILNYSDVANAVKSIEQMEEEQLSVKNEQFGEDFAKASEEAKESMYNQKYAEIRNSLTKNDIEGELSSSEEYQNASLTGNLLAGSIGKEFDILNGDFSIGKETFSYDIIKQGVLNAYSSVGDEVFKNIANAIDSGDEEKVKELLNNLTETELEVLQSSSADIAYAIKSFESQTTEEQQKIINDLLDKKAQEQLDALLIQYDAAFVEDKQLNRAFDEFKKDANNTTKIWLNNLSKQQKKALMMSGVEKLDSTYTQAELEALLKRGNVNRNRQIADSMSSDVNTLQNDMFSNKYDMHTIGDSQEFSNLKANFETLLDQVPELKDEIDVLNTAALTGTKEWNDALYAVESKLNEFKLAGYAQDFADAKEDLDNLIEASKNDHLYSVKTKVDETTGGTRDKNGQLTQEIVKIDIDSEEGLERFQEELDNILNADYAINIEIHAQAENAFEDFESSMNQITKMADKIGEGYIVAASDLRELNQAFPGIIEGYKTLEDGTVQLKDTVVKSSMEAAQAEIEASKESTIAKLTMQRDFLVQKRKHYMNILAIATQTDASEELSAKEVEDVKAELDEIEKLNDKIVTDSELSNDEMLANSSQINAQISAANWEEAARVADESWLMAATDMANYMAAAAEGKAPGNKGSLALGKLSVNTGNFKSGKKSEATNGDSLKSSKDVTSSTSRAEIINSASNMVDSLTTEIADLNGMIAGTDGLANAANANLKNRGSGKGSGKSSGSSSDADTMDLLNDELDIYHDINIEIEKQEKLLSRLEKEAENLYGQQLIDNLNKQNEALEAENVALEKKHELMLQDIKDRQKVLNAQGVSFDENGQVIDYNGLLAQREAYVNSEIAKYNAMDANSQKAYKNVVEQAKTDYETLKTQLEAYEELVNETLSDLEDTMDEKRKQVLANNLKKWETEIEIHLDLKEAEREWNDFLGDIMADFTKQWEDLDLSFNMNVKDFNTYLGDDGTLATRAQEIKDIEAEIDKLEKTGKSDKYESITQAQEALKQAQKDWMGDVQAFRNAYKAAYDDYMKEIDQIGDKFDSIIDKYKHINELLDFQKDLIGLIYGDEAYGLMSDYYDAQIYNNNSMIDSYKQQLDADRALLSTLKEGDEDYEKVQKRIMENENNMNKLILDNIKLIKEDYANSIKAAADSMMKNITGMSYSAMSEEWDKIKAENADHFDEIQSMYQIANFESTVKIAIDDAGSIKAQQKLQELYEQEVATLKEREELTQYDIDAANKRLEIAQKEIALEDAQNAKNSMKVVRGTDGNWSYQYVADDDDLESKRQDLANSYAELYDMAKKAEEEAYDNLMNNYDKTVERLVNMVEKGYISEEEFKQAMLQAQEDFELQSERIAERDKIYRQDMLASSVAIANVAYATDAKNFSEKNAEMTKVVEECMTANASSYSDYAKLILDESSPEGLSAIGNQVHTIVSDANPAWTSGIGALAAACGKDSEQKQMIDEFWADANQAISDYHTKIGEVETKSGTSFGNVKNSIDSCKTSTDSLANATSEVVKQMDALYNKKSVLDEMANQWNNVKGAVESTKNEIDEYLKKVQASIEQTKKDLSSLGAAYANAAQPTTVNSGGSGRNLTYNSGATAITYDYKIETNPNGVANTWGLYNKSGKLLEMTTRTNNIEDQWIDKLKDSKKYTGKTVMKSDRKSTTKLATGGYTGEWGAEGKMAMLHEKELVLNKQDTSNILSVVNMVRGIVDGIGGGMLNKLASVANSGVTSNSAMNESSNVVYNVSCEFPNAGDIATIQEAIYTLPDKLTQMFGQRTVR